MPAPFLSMITCGILMSAFIGYPILNFTPAQGKIWSQKPSGIFFLASFRASEHCTSGRAGWEGAMWETVRDPPFTLTAASVAPTQAMEAAVCRWQPPLKPAVPFPSSWGLGNSQQLCSFSCRKRSETEAFRLLRRSPLSA